MSSGFLSEKIVQRDGTGQAQRQKATLQPDFIPMEERSLPDWIAFAKEYARELRFFNENNEAAGTWEGFLAEIDSETLVRYIDNPDAFSRDADTVARLSRPHVVLFVAFLQLLGYIKDQLNGFTKKHLDFYYYNILGLTVKGPVPDEANIIIQLAEDVQELLVDKDTRLLAGQDSEGNDLVYVTGRDTLITGAAVQKIKTLYTGKTTTTLLQVKGKNNKDRLLQMFQLALGSPHPGDPLPGFNGKPVDMDTLETISSSAAADPHAAEYINRQLHLFAEEFKYIIDFYDTPAADWEQIAYYLKKAYSKKIRSYSTLPPSSTEANDSALWEQNLVVQEPEVVTWENGYAVADAAASAFTIGSDEKATRYFNTFGKTGVEKEKSAAQTISTGFAVSAPLLLLQEGKRTIRISLQFANTAPAPDSVFPFLPYLSTSDGWLQLQTTQFSYQYLEMQDGDTTYLQIVVEISLKDTDPAITAPSSANSAINIRSVNPVLALVLQPESASGSYYGVFKTLQLKGVKVNVTVTDLKALTLQNDDGVLNYKKPFEPFGATPVAGSRFYFAHPEICSKPLSALTLHFTWMNAPADFGEYYEAYGKTENGKSLQNKDFTADVNYVNEGVAQQLRSNLALFESGDASLPHAETVNISGLSYRMIATAGEATNWSRYFSLTLNAPDFQHTAYPQVLIRNAYKKEDNTEPSPPPNPPYTPKLQSLTADYEAGFEIAMDTYEANGINQLFHIHAFGYTQVEKKAKTALEDNEDLVYFLPQFQYEGELYIGISNINVPQNLSLFFQLAEGSANPEMTKPTVYWSILGNNAWLPLSGASIVYDSTNGLLNTGIVELAIPAGATNHNTLLDDGLYWLRAAVLTNTEAIPDTVTILAQGIKAVFTDNVNAPDHYLSLLPPDSIQETEASIPKIKKISQPYSSSRGRPAEEDARFYTRVSERLRHKDRALTMWDYEHLVLEQFPEIYKVKCLPGAANGAVEMIVIPNIKGKLPFNPFEPKAPSDVIASIEQYLVQRAPAWADIRVKNPSYIQVKVRIAVKIKEGLSENFFLAKLENELIRYLAPWAYDEGADIYLDTRLDADVIVNFVAERPYVAFASDIYLFINSGDGFKAVYPGASGEYYVQAKDPGDVLVSAATHEIDRIKNYVANDYRGIGYMKIGLDFKIGE